MLKKHAQLFEGLFLASDLLVVSAAWIFSYWLRFSSGLIPIEKGVPGFGDYLRMLIFVWLIWAFVFRRFGLYRPMRGVSRYTELWLVIRATSFSVVLLLAATYIFREKTIPFSRLVFLIFWFSATLFAIWSRSIIRGILRFMRKRGYNLRYVLIVGAGGVARSVADRIVSHPEYGLELVGCLSGEGLRDVSYKSSFDGNTVVRSSSESYAMEAVDPGLKTKIIGNYSDVPELLSRGGIDQVIIALPLSDHFLIESVMSYIGDSIVDIRVVPDVHKFVQLGSLVEELNGLPVISLASTPLSGINTVAKRIFDIIVGTALFILFSPLMLLIAALVKVTSTGPVLFSQERVGLDGRSFKIFKYRTMTVNAEDNGAQFAVKNDPRTTVIGRFLRSTSLDELPQLINVILGQMSLVGPRPERPVFIEEFRRHVPKYMLRHKVQAGMTGWAQINGWRGNTSIERRIEHDLYYIEHWSLFLDIRILWLTLFRGFLNRNAY
jgi:Undecaprenyl-phosphate glucose phosphotransferase